MEDLVHTIFSVLVFLIFTGAWVWFLYSIFRFFLDRYEKKPLEYVSIKKVNKNNIENNKMDNQQQSQSQQSKSKWNKLSITGFILSIISIFGIGLAGLIGFILGIVALVQIRNRKERGKWLAMAAIIIGFIWSFVVGILKKLI